MFKVLAAGLLILAATISAPIAAPALAVAPLNASGAAAEVDIGTVADRRIGSVFAALSEGAVDPAIAAAAARAPKGDFAPTCTNAVWPNIDNACFATPDGRPARHVRMISTGYQVGESTTVLVRSPVAETVQR